VARVAGAAADAGAMPENRLAENTLKAAQMQVKYDGAAARRLAGCESSQAVAVQRLTRSSLSRSPEPGGSARGMGDEQARPAFRGRAVFFRMGASMTSGGDYLVRATALDERVRAFALDATGVVSELQRRHGTHPAATAALGRTAMGALLLAAASLKEREQVLTVDIRGDGPIGRILATADGGGAVRGMVGNPRVHAESVRPGKLNVAGVVGTEGYVSVTRDLGMREHYRGLVELVSGEIGEDLAYYLYQSEQVPSAVGIGVFVLPDLSVEAAGGFLLQLLPGLSDDEIAAIEGRVADLPHPTELIRSGMTPEEVLERIFPEGYAALDSYPVSFHCPCSRARFEAGIISLGAAEIERIIAEEEQERTEVVCHFCNEAYHFGRGEMEAILAEASGG
jgi:molecular chaperone Hsp33